MAQTTGRITGNGIVFSDSLRTFKGSTVASDTSHIKAFALGYGFFSITVKDTGTTYTDSLKLYKGVIRYSEDYNHTPVDTLWATNALPVYTNSWTSDTTLVGAGKIKTYTILENNIQLLKIQRVNATVVQGIVVPYVLEARKKD